MKNLFQNHIQKVVNPFRSLWMAGYECTDKLNAFGNRVDFLNLTGHLEMLDEDYRNLSYFNIITVREGIRWSHVEKQPYHYNWKDVEKMILAGKRYGIQQVWDICHFGFPDDLTPLHPMFAKRFAALCRAFVRFYRSIDADGVLIVTPFNEVGFVSWLGGDVCGTSPYCRGYGWHVKYALMRAYIEGIEAMKEEDINIRILITEPLVNMVAPLNATEEELTGSAKAHEAQYQVFDILSGRMCPELRGKPEYLDIIGCNYYFNNQWVTGTSEFLPWRKPESDARWLPLEVLMMQVYERYQRPMVLAETSHPGVDRPLWIDFISRECAKFLNKGLPLWGICWYPVIDRPDWDHLHPWHQAGLWDVEISEDGKLNRILDQPASLAFLDAQTFLEKTVTKTNEKIFQ